MSVMFRFIKVLSVAVLALIALSLVAFGVLAWRLSEGPVSLGFAQALVESAVQDRLEAGATFSYADAVMTYRSGSSLAVRIRDAEYTAGPVVADAPEVVLDFSVRGFLSGQLYPETVTADDVMVEIHSPAGGPEDPLAAFKTNGRLEYPSELLSKLEDRLAAAAAEFASGGLRQVRVQNAAATVFDSFGNQVTDIRSIGLVSRLQADGSGSDSALTFNPGRGQVTVRLQHGISGQEHFLRVNIDNVSLAEIVPNLRRREGAGATQLLQNVPYLFGYVDFRKSDNGRVFLSVSADMGAGYFWLGPDGLILVDEANAHLVWDNERLGFSVENLSASAGLTEISMGGAIKWPEKPRVGISYYLQNRNSQVGGGRSWRGERTIPIRDIVVAGQIAPDLSIITADRFRLDVARGQVIGTGSVDLAPDDPVLGFAANIRNIQLSTGLAFWPSVISPQLRRWVLGQVRGGIVETAEVTAAIPFSAMKPVDGRIKLPDQAMESRVRIKNAALVPFGDLPIIAGITADVRSTGRTVDVRGEGGWYDSEAGRVDILEGTYQVNDLWEFPMQAKLELVGAGSVEAVSEILDADPLRLVTNQEFRTTDLSGSFSGTLTSTFPLKPKIAEDEFRYLFEGRVEKFASLKPVNGRRISEGGLNLTVDNEKAVVSGGAKLDGVDAKVDFTQRFDEPDNADTGVSMVLGDEERLKLGIDLTGFVSGQVEVQTENTDEPDRVRVTMDLTDARLSVSAMNWSKGAGVKAGATFDVVTEANGTLVDNFRLEGEGFDAEGTIRLGPKGEFVRARFSRIRLRRDDDISAVIEATPGGYTASVTGDYIDARPMIDALGETGQTDDTIVFSVKIANVLGHNGIYLNNLSATGRQEGNFPVAIDGTAAVNGKVQVSMTTRGSGQTRSLVAQTLDGGAVLRFMNIYKYAFGGNMTFVSTWNPAIEGEASEFSMTDFRVIDEPALARLTAADPVEPEDRDRNRVVRQRNERQPGTRFTRAQGKFQRIGAQIRLSNFNVYGPELGVTVRGEVNFDNRRVDISGTYIPAYRLNSFFSRVPIIGNALSLRRSEGILGVTFRVSDTIENPVLSINPLSAIAPGIFRGFFEYR